MEKSHSARQLYDSRQAFTRSTALFSIMGSIVSLADRHLQNILIDDNTFECVHIDLGIAFGAGKYLPCPDDVPCRLTRDIVDGMDATGVSLDGMFASAARIVSTAVQKESGLIRLVLSSLANDPLFKWGLTAQKEEDRSVREGEQRPGEKRSEHQYSTPYGEDYAGDAKKRVDSESYYSLEGPDRDTIRENNLFSSQTAALQMGQLRQDLGTLYSITMRSL